MESVLQSQVNQLLRDKDIEFYHVAKSVNPRRPPKGGGIPDIMIWPGFGKVFFVELKGPKGVMSKVQLEWKERMEDRGYSHYTCRTLEEFKWACKEQSVLLD